MGAVYQIFKFFTDQHIWMKHRNGKSEKLLIEVTDSDKDTKIIFHTLLGNQAGFLATIFSGQLIEKNLTSKSIVTDIGFCMIVGTKNYSKFDFTISKNYLDLLKKYIRQGYFFSRRFKNILKTGFMIISNYKNKKKPVCKESIATRSIFEKL